MTRSDPGPNNVKTPIFGLTKGQLRPIVESMAGEAVAEFEVCVEHDIPGFRGYSAEKVIPTVAYTTRSGRRGRATAFVKWFHEPGPREAHHYRHLATLDAPIPRTYGAVTMDDREMIFLEYLRPIGDVEVHRRFLDDPDRFRRFLAVIARFNAMRPSEQYTAELPRRDFKRELAAVPAVLERIWANARAGELGEEIEQLCRAEGLARLRALCQEVAGAVATMEPGLAHNDFYSDSTAWRCGSGELLIIDLESVALGPRFFDVARWLGAPEQIEARCLPQGELAACYLDHYVRWGGRAVALDQFLYEAYWLWLAGALRMMFFPYGRALDGRVDWTDDRDEARRDARRGLRDELTKLLRAVELPDPP